MYQDDATEIAGGYHTKCGHRVWIDTHRWWHTDNGFGGSHHYWYRGSPVINCVPKNPDCERMVHRQQLLNGEWMYCQLCRSDDWEYETSMDKVFRDSIAMSSYRFSRLIKTGHDCCANVREGRNGGVDTTISFRRCIQFGANGCDNHVCVITGEKFSDYDMELVNIYADMEYTQTTGLMQQTIVKKGIRMLDNKIPRHLAELALKEIEYEAAMELDYWSHKRKFEGRPPCRLYIRKKRTRNLMEDLQNAAQGISTINALDEEKKNKQGYHERKAKRIAAERSRLYNLALNKGINGLSGIDQYRIKKRLSSAERAVLPSDAPEILAIDQIPLIAPEQDEEAV